MTAALGLLSVIIGAAIACNAERLSALLPACLRFDAAALQTGAGLLLIAGLALCGCALPAAL